MPSGLAPPGAVERAAAPFEQRSGRAAAAASVQLCLACLLLGAFAAAGRRRGWGLIAWVVVGAGAGLVLGLNDAARGTVGVGDAILYEVAPRGRAGLREAVTAVALLPAATAVLFAAVGASLRARLVGPTGPTPPVPGAAP